MQMGGAQGRGFLNHVPKCGQISKKRANFLIGLPSKTKKRCSEQNRQPKSLPPFLIEETFINFRDFSYDLENGETFENATVGDTIRFQNIRLKKFARFLNICPDLYKSRQPVQRSSDSSVWQDRCLMKYQSSETQRSRNVVATTELEP